MSSVVDLKDGLSNGKKPHKSYFELTKIGMLYLAVEMLSSCHVAITIPILLKLKVSEKAYSFVYIISPFLAFLFQPVLGVLSDRCENKFGRRRPYLLILSILSLIGVTFILNGTFFGYIFGDFYYSKPYAGVFVIFTGATLVGFAADSCFGPLRAYLIDNCNVEDQNIGFNIHNMLGGFGSAIGYLLIGLDFKSIFQNSRMDENQIIFIIILIICVICIVTTMVSAKEEQFKLENGSNEKEVMNSKKEDLTNSLKVLYESLKNIPKEFLILLFTQTFGWLALVSSVFFFTTFMARGVYKGDPLASSSSIELEYYNYGTKMGSYCLLIYSVSFSVTSFVFERFLMHKITTKSSFLSAYAFYLICCIFIYLSTNAFEIMPLSFSFGLLKTALTTLPFQMISKFHEKESFKINNEHARGLGIDCSLLCSSLFLSQTIVSSFMGYFTYFFGFNAIPILSGIFSISAFVLTLFFVIFP